MNRGSLRDYVCGDPLRLIHWPSTARHDSFLVKEFETETAGQVWLILDFEQTVHVGQGPDSTQEYSIILTASLAAQLLHQGLPVGLWAWGQDDQRCFLQPAPGRGHLWDLLRALAPLEPGEQPLSALLREAAYVLPRGSAALIITPSIQPEWPRQLFQIKQQGVGATVWLLDAGSFAEVEDPSQTSQRAAGRLHGLRGALAIQQIDTQVIRLGDLNTAKPLESGGGRWKFKVLPTGRVIVVSRPTPVGETGK